MSTNTCIEREKKKPKKKQKQSRLLLRGSFMHGVRAFCFTMRRREYLQFLFLQLETTTIINKMSHTSRNYRIHITKLYKRNGRTILMCVHFDMCLVCVRAWRRCVEKRCRIFLEIAFVWCVPFLFTEVAFVCVCVCECKEKGRWVLFETKFVSPQNRSTCQHVFIYFCRILCLDTHS